MKPTNFAIAFIAIFLLINSGLQMKINNLNAVVNLHAEYQNALNDATNICIDGIDPDLSGNVFDVGTKNVVLDKFFNDLYSEFGVMSDKEKQELLQLYVPVFVEIDNDGFDVSYCTAYKGKLARVWSQKYAYAESLDNYVVAYRLDDSIAIYNKSKNRVFTGNYEMLTREPNSDFSKELQLVLFDLFNNTNPNSCKAKFEQHKTNIIISTLQEKIGYYVYQHDTIARNNNINISYDLPLIANNNWESIIKAPGVFALFRGKTYASGTAEEYVQTLISFAHTDEASVYYVIQNKENGLYYYHKRYCNFVDDVLRNAVDPTTLEKYTTKQEAAKHGAYACEECSP